MDTYVVFINWVIPFILLSNLKNLHSYCVAKHPWKYPGFVLLFKIHHFASSIYLFYSLIPYLKTVLSKTVVTSHV